MPTRAEEFWKQRLHQEAQGYEYNHYYAKQNPNRYARPSLDKLAKTQELIRSSPLGREKHFAEPGHLTYDHQSIAPRDRGHPQFPRSQSVQGRFDVGSNVYAPGHCFPAYTNAQTQSLRAQTAAFPLNGGWGTQAKRKNFSITNPRQRSWQMQPRRVLPYALGVSNDQVDRAYRYRNNNKLECNYGTLRNSGL